MSRVTPALLVPPFSRRRGLSLSLHMRQCTRWAPALAALRRGGAPVPPEFGHGRIQGGGGYALPCARRTSLSGRQQLSPPLCEAPPLSLSLCSIDMVVQQPAVATATSPLLLPRYGSMRMGLDHAVASAGQKYGLESSSSSSSCLFLCPTMVVHRAQYCHIWYRAASGDSVFSLILCFCFCPYDFSLFYESCSIVWPIMPAGPLQF